MLNAPQASRIAPHGGIRAPSRTRYAALAFLLSIALIYQVRYTEFRFPSWFGRQVVQYPFAVFPDSKGPRFSAYTYSGSRVSDVHNGDLVLSVNGKPMTGTSVFGEVIANSRPGDSITFTVRSGPNAPVRTVHARLEAARPPLLDSFATWTVILITAVLPWFCIVLGVWVTLARLQDIRAWLLLALMLSFASYFTPGTESWEPWLRDYAVVYHAASADFLAIWLLLFGIYFPEPFPRESRWGRWVPWKWIIIAPLAFEALCDAITSVGALENYASVYFIQRVLIPLRAAFNLLDLIAVIALFLCLALKIRIQTSPDAKRRLRVLIAGALVSLCPVVGLAVVAHLLGVSMEQYFPSWVYLAAWLLFFLFPVTLAYVIVVHRAMDVRVVIRQGLQYALARRGVRVLRVLFAVVLGFTMFSLLNRVGRSPLYYVIIALAVAIWIWFRRLSEMLAAWIDRRFFRDAYNAEQLLAELSERVRSIVETHPLLTTVSERISQSLHVSQIAVLINASGPYQPAYALGYDAMPHVAFPDDAATVRQLRESRQPARVYIDDPNSWIYRAPDVTDEERARLAVLRSELLLPLSVKDNLLGFISLSQKRSQEPYSPTDLRLLESVAAQTGLALEVARLTTAMTVEIARRERLSREVEIAREVQERLFPQQQPPTPGLDYCGACRPALGVGGDYYDFLAFTRDRLGIAVGDVSGKGIAAALMMASLQASLRAQTSRADDNLGPMIGEVNRLLFEASTQNRYATFFYAQYDPATRNLAYVNAGHNPPMLFKNGRPACEPIRLDAGGTVIGLLKSASYRDAIVTLDEGDLLVIFTDGITETMNAADDEWGEANLMQAVSECRDLPPNAILTHIMQAADAFAAGAEQHDDMTLVILRVASGAGLQTCQSGIHAGIPARQYKTDISQ